MSVYFWKMHAIDKLKVQNTLDVIFRININYAELSRLYDCLKNSSKYILNVIQSASTE